LITPEALAERFIPFAGLKYSTEAFIDYCIPASTPKYNYALIGPGVSQNPNQPVSLREPHGFQVGGVSMPHGKTNPAHMHFTCEVFICTRGDWRIEWGFNPQVQSAPLGEGDLVSVPTWIYRGFTNIGVDDGFMFTALGGDNTGGILWGPSTLQAAAAQGVQLTEGYRIVDSRRGDRMEPDERPVQPMTAEEIAQLKHWPPSEMARRIVRFADLGWSSRALLDASLPGCGAELAPAIGLGVSQDRDQLAPVQNPHGLSIEWVRIPPGGQISRHRLQEKQVLIVKKGAVDVSVDTTAGPITYRAQGQAKAWDTFSLPDRCWRTLRNPGTTSALGVLMTAGDHRKRIEWDPTVCTHAATETGWALDANGYVAEKRFVDRAQR
jgi:quercetin dioxygenase-like cupin family protein